jgi:hypothetical protein
MYLEEDYGKIALKGRARRQARREARRKKRGSLSPLEQRRKRQRLRIPIIGGLSSLIANIKQGRISKMSPARLRRYRSMLQKRLARLKGRDRDRAKDRVAEAKMLISKINQQLSKKGGDDMGFYGNLGTNTSSAIRKGLIPMVTPQSYMMQSYAGLGFYPGAYAGEDEDAPVVVAPEPGIVGKVVQGVKDYPEWWKEQNLFVQIAVPAAFLFAVYQIPAVKRRAKKMMKKGR